MWCDTNGVLGVFRFHFLIDFVCLYISCTWLEYFFESEREREREGRERERERERDRDRDKRIDRQKPTDRQRERERETNENDRDREKERERQRQRGREGVREQENENERERERERDGGEQADKHKKDRQGTHGLIASGQKERFSLKKHNSKTHYSDQWLPIVVNMVFEF